MLPFLVATFLSIGRLGQCPSFSVQHVTGPACGPLVTEAPDVWGMSSSGHMICGGTTTCQVEHFAFVWQGEGPLTPVTFPVKTSYSKALDVNLNGTVVGEVDADGQAGRRGFKFQQGTTTFLQPPPGGLMTFAVAVNNRDLVVGDSTGDGVEAVYWLQAEPVSLKPSLPLGPNSRATDVNDVGQICGWMGLQPSPLFGATPFIWHTGKTISLPLPPYAAANSGLTGSQRSRRRIAPQHCQSLR